MKLEEYILKRKTEDGINEFDRDKRAENTRICVNYVFEYFNNYLETTAGEERTILHDEKIEKYARMVERYSDDIQEWLVDMYSSYGKYLHRTLPTFIQDPFFLLYDTEAEFRALSYDVYPKIIKRYKFLNGHAEMIYRFLKDEHHTRSLVPEEYGLPFITEGINDWMEKTYLKHGVNMYSFCSEYMADFLDNPENLPQVNHKDEDKHNNCAENLEWCSAEYNTNYGTRNERMAKAQTNHPKKSKPVGQFSLDGKLIKVWPSTNEAGRNGFDGSCVSACCRGEQKTHKTYTWRYL